MSILSTLLILAAVTPSRPVTPPIDPVVTPTRVTVAQVLSIRALQGAKVAVQGRCLAPNSRAIAEGSRPQSGNVWQLEDQGVATWVVGDMPRACADGKVTITARVSHDLVPRFSPPRGIQQYLTLE